MLVLLVLNFLLSPANITQQQVNETLPNIQLNTTLIGEFGQCGGLEWNGSVTCRENLVCYKRSKYYSQCLTSNTTRSAAQIIPLGGKCYGGDQRNLFVCTVGTACFIQIENVHGECRESCPENWFCANQTLPEWAPCGGEGYIGLTKCKQGLKCYKHSDWYQECRSECPAGWKC